MFESGTTAVHVCTTRVFFIQKNKIKELCSTFCVYTIYTLLYSYSHTHVKYTLHMHLRVVALLFFIQKNKIKELCSFLCVTHCLHLFSYNYYQVIALIVICHVNFEQHTRLLQSLVFVV